MGYFEYKKHLCSLLSFVLVTDICYSYDKVVCSNHNGEGVTRTINSFFEKMNEDRENQKNKYESCRYNQECEIWVSPKVDIYELESKLRDYIYNHSNYVIVEDSSGKVIKIMELELNDFFRNLDAKIMKEFEEHTLMANSIIYHWGARLELYNLDSFFMEGDMLLVNVKSLANIIQGYRYRLDIDLLTSPKYGFLYEKRRYPLNQCGEVINFNKYELELYYHK